MIHHDIRTACLLYMYIKAHASRAGRVRGMEGQGVEIVEGVVV